MGKKISEVTRNELLKALRIRYQKCSKLEKMHILNEFVAVSGYHRKHAIRLLCSRKAKDKMKQTNNDAKTCHGLKIYDEAVKKALILTWEAADRICGKRLKAILPDIVGSMERHGHMDLDAEVKMRLLSASASTIDRMLAPVRRQAKPRKKQRKPSKVNKKIPIRTFADWNDPDPGYLEIDFVVHCGGSMTGTFIHTLAVTDICSGWTDCLPLLARGQSLVVEGLDALFGQIPFPIKGIDSDNDSAFINDTLLEFCKARQIEFTRSRAYRKNDQAWIEQKNGAVVRRLVGYERFSGIVVGQALAHLYQAARLYTNYFQPSFKLREKIRNGAKVKRIYYPPETPCARLLEHKAVDAEIKEALRSQREKLDPLELLHHIREGQAALVALASDESATDASGNKTLDHFLAQLPELWKCGEVRPTHRKKQTKPRHWRTRKDPFEGVWIKILSWLQQDPDTTAKALFDRLQGEYPGRFPDSQLRTLQRRIRDWRQVMAKKLVYACIDGTCETAEAKVVI